MKTKLPLLLGLLALAQLGLPARSSAQSGDTNKVHADYRNVLYIAPLRPEALTNAQTTLDTAIRVTNLLARAEFNSVACYNGSAATSTNNNSYPNDGAYFLKRSVIATPFDGAPRIVVGRTFRFGEAITNIVSLGIDDARQPASIDPPTGARFVPGMGRTVGTEVGFVTITWYRTNGVMNSPVTYYIQDEPVQPPVRIYWTKDAGGKPTGVPPVTNNPSLLTVTPYYNLGVKPAVLQLSGGVLNAQNGQGKIVLDYTNKTTGTLIGLEILDIRPFSPDLPVTMVDVGAWLAPHTNRSAIKPLVSRGLATNVAANTPAYAYQYLRAGDTNDGQVFAVRQSLTTGTNIEVFWFRTNLAGVVWPYEVHHYLADWPATFTNLARRIYVTEKADGTPTGAPEVSIPTNAAPTVLVHNSEVLSRNLCFLDATNRLLHARVQSGRILLHYEQPGTPGLIGLQFVDVRPYKEDYTDYADVGAWLTPHVTATNNFKPLVSWGLLDSQDAQTNPVPHYAYQYNRTNDPDDGKAFAVRPTSAADQVELFWLHTGLANVVWPYEMHRYTSGWPADFANRCRKIYLTQYENGNDTKAPPVSIPSSLVPNVTIHNNQVIPPGDLAAGKQWFWLNETTRNLNARWKTGRVLIHYERPTTPGFIGLQFVDVVAYDPNRVDAGHIGDRLLPYDASYPETHGLTPHVSIGYNETPPPDYAYQHRVTGSAMNGYTFAIRKTTTDTQIELIWKRNGLAGVAWPYEMHRYTADWPPVDRRDKYQRYVRGEAPGNLGPDVAIPGDLKASVDAYQYPAAHTVPPTDGEHYVPLSGQTFATTSPGWSLLRYSPTNEVYFQVVHSVQHTDTSEFNLALNTWTNGTRIEDLSHQGPRGGYIHVLDTTTWPKEDRYHWRIYYNSTNQMAAPTNRWDWMTNTVYAVNRGKLEVWWSNVNTNGNLPAATVQWPSLVKRYDNVWPTNAEKMDIASHKGSGALNVNNWYLYFQNETNQPGYNPNDEHAASYPAHGPAGQHLEVYPSGVNFLEGGWASADVLVPNPGLIGTNITLTLSSSREG